MAISDIVYTAVLLHLGEFEGPAIAAEAAQNGAEAEDLLSLTPKLATPGVREEEAGASASSIA